MVVTLPSLPVIPLYTNVESRTGQGGAGYGMSRPASFGSDPTGCNVCDPYVVTPHMAKPALTSEMKKGSAELLILAILEDGQRHGYEIAQQIERRSRGAISFHVASLYPMLYRLEARGLIEGRWVEKAGQRRRRYYRLTAEGAEVLAAQRSLWQEFFTGINRVARLRPT